MQKVPQSLRGVTCDLRPRVGDQRPGEDPHGLLNGIFFRFLL